DDTPVRRGAAALPSCPPAVSLVAQTRLAISSSLLGGREIRAHALEHFRRHADGFTQSRVRMDSLADVDRIASHLHGEADLAAHAARMGADDAAAEHAVIGFVEQELGEAFVAPVGDRATRCRPRKHRLAVLDALRLALLFGG